MAVFTPGKNAAKGTRNRFDLVANLDSFDAKSNGVTADLVRALAQKKYSARIEDLYKADPPGTLAGLAYIFQENAKKTPGKRAALSGVKSFLPPDFLTNLETTTGRSRTELYGKGVDDDEDDVADPSTATRDEIYNLLAQQRVGEAYKLIQRRGVAVLGKAKAHALLKALHSV